MTALDSKLFEQYKNDFSIFQNQIDPNLEFSDKNLLILDEFVQNARKSTESENIQRIIRAVSYYLCKYIIYKDKSFNICKDDQTGGIAVENNYGVRHNVQVWVEKAISDVNEVLSSKFVSILKNITGENETEAKKGQILDGIMTAKVECYMCGAEFEVKQKLLTETEINQGATFLDICDCPECGTSNEIHQDTNNNLYTK